MKKIFLIIASTAILFSACEQQQKNKTNHPAADSPSRSISCAVPVVVDKAWYASGKKALLFSGLEGNHFPISTKNQEAQKYFDQGLMLSYGFNHAEAARSFHEITKIDSTCAMAWWGFAYVLGPNYNAGMEPDNFQRAYDAAQKAKSLFHFSTEKEKMMIEALSHRYSNDTSVARAILDSTYAAEMREIYKKYPDDTDIATLFAESLMNLHPWNLWKKDGTIQPWT